MPAFITSRPEKLVSGNLSRWSAVTNPVIFVVERQDLNMIGIADNGGLVEVEAISVADLLPFGPVVGDKVYIKSGPYDEVATIQAFTSPVTFTLDIIFTNTTSGGIMNFLTKRTNYRLQASILKIVNNTYQPIVTTGIFRSNEKGITNIDISTWLKTLPKMINEFQYDKRNEKDVNLGDSYLFQIRELYTDPSGAFEGVFPNTDDGNVNYFVNAARQIQDEHGGNMAQFVPFGTDVIEAEKALFLSGFVEPTRFDGYPFDLQFIYSDNIQNRETKKEERSRDINEILKDTNSDILDNSQTPNVNRLTLEEGYDPLAKGVDVWLQTDFAIQDPRDQWADDGYSDTGYDGAPPEETTEPIRR